MNFDQALVECYRQAPCQVLPNALWKTISGLETLTTRVKVEGDSLQSLEAYDREQHLLYWHRHWQPPRLTNAQLATFELVLTHQKYLLVFPERYFPNREAFFRLIHQGDTPTGPRLPKGFTFAPANPHREAGPIAGIINQCYPGMHLSLDTIHGWARHPVFSPDLWVWVIETCTQKPVGLGIAELDPTLPEASLEWVQMLPAYQGRGLGTALVVELLRRIQGRVTFTTVSGRVDNATNPEGLYHRCGFGGEDVWWVLRK